MNASGCKANHGLALAISSKQGLISKIISPHATLLCFQNGSSKPRSLVSLRNFKLVDALQCHAFTPALIYTKGSRLPLTTRSSSGEQANTDNDDGLEARNLSNALLLAFSATQDRSLFSSKCLIETAIEIYRRGFTLDNIKLDVTLATLTTSGDPLKPLMLDILLTWTAVVMMTLQTIGVPLLPEGEARAARRAQQQDTVVKNDDKLAEHEDRMSQALEFFVKDCVQRFKTGTNLFRLQLQQSMQGPIMGESPEIAGRSQAVEMMQQNSRLAIITLELVKSSGLPTKMSLDVKPLEVEDEGKAENEEEESKENDEESGEEEEDLVQKRRNTMPPTHISYIDGFVDPSKAPSPTLQGLEKTAAIRCAATRLLITFNGAALGYLRSARDFIDQLYACYSAGWTADELFSALYDEEFAQSGGVTFSIANTPGGKHINAALFARWITLTYMAMALLGVEHPGASTQAGWAWVEDLSGASGVSSGGGLEAHAIAEFVSSTLRIAVQSDEGSGGDEKARDAGGRKWGGVQRPIDKGMPPQQSLDTLENENSYGAFSVTGIEDPTLMRTSSFAAILSHEISLVRLTRLVVLQKRGEPAAVV
ncbi:hypothetical protein Ndes2437B_g00161 [Nannochloris sp. 'desiccata']